MKKEITIITMFLLIIGSTTAIFTDEIIQQYTLGPRNFTVHNYIYLLENGSILYIPNITNITWVGGNATISWSNGQNFTTPNLTGPTGATATADNNYTSTITSTNTTNNITITLTRIGMANISTTFPATIGPKGDKGDTGDTGPAGTNGTNGADGVNGTNGSVSRIINETNIAGLLDADKNLTFVWLGTLEDTRIASANKWNTLNNLSLSQIVASIGNWSADKSSYTLLSQLQTTNNTVNSHTTSISGIQSNITSIGNWSADKSSYATLTQLQNTNNTVNSHTTSISGIQTNITSIGNWTSDKSSYYTTTQIDNQNTIQNNTITSLGNWSADKANYALLSQLQDSNNTINTHTSQISGIQTNITNNNVTLTNTITAGGTSSLVI